LTAEPFTARGSRDRALRFAADHYFIVPGSAVVAIVLANVVSDTAELHQR